VALAGGGAVSIWRPLLELLTTFFIGVGVGVAITMGRFAVKASRMFAELRAITDERPVEATDWMVAWDRHMEDCAPPMRPGAKT
jgi:hypothetical protein